MERATEILTSQHFQVHAGQAPLADEARRPVEKIQGKPKSIKWLSLLYVIILYKSASAYQALNLWHFPPSADMTVGKPYGDGLLGSPLTPAESVV